jgi:glucose/arabinose dehydrogenase
MPKILLFIALTFDTAQPNIAGEPKPRTLIGDLKLTTSIAVAPNGRILATDQSDADRGKIVEVKDGKPNLFAAISDEISGLASYQQWVFTAGKKGIWRIDSKGKAEIFAPASAFFSEPPQFLYRIAIDHESGTLYATGSDNTKGGAVIFRVDSKGKVSVISDKQRWPDLAIPWGLALDGASHLLMTDTGAGGLHRIKLADGSHEKVAGGLENPGALVWDMYGRLFIFCDRKIFVIARPGSNPVPLKHEFMGLMDGCLDPLRSSLLVVDFGAGTILQTLAAVPGQPVDFSPLPFETAVAFPDLKWTGWQGETDAGKVNPLRPLVLTHAGDGSNRNFVATQQGVIHVFPNDQKAKESKVFLDIQDKVRYKDQENEEGFLGLAFHPDYKKTGEFFAFYTPKKEKLVNVVSRFRVSKEDPDRADPASEEEIFRVKRPFWNHDGGTIVFGPDGMLYIALGDGGAANDPFNNGQNLKQPLGKILRIDINKKDPGKSYAIPPGNPFDDRKDAIPETWAYGLRNVWRMAFDKKTGKLWAADVGQNLYEEIDIIERGGNYGWRLREGLHPFGPGGSGPRKDLIDPIWEYHHDIGKSLTGGFVYRGKQFPELDGYYLCADYVTGKIWALKYSEKEKRVTEWRSIRDKSLPIMSFGEDDRGEAYLMTYAASGRGIYRLVRTEKK